MLCDRRVTLPSTVSSLRGVAPPVVTVGGARDGVDRGAGVGGTLWTRHDEAPTQEHVTWMSVLPGLGTNVGYRTRTSGDKGTSQFHVCCSVCCPEYVEASVAIVTSEPDPRPNLRYQPGCFPGHGRCGGRAVLREPHVLHAVEVRYLARAALVRRLYTSTRHASRHKEDPVKSRQQRSYCS